jgi:hypothetical protein
MARSSYFDFASLHSIRTEVSANFNELLMAGQAGSVDPSTRGETAMMAFRMRFMQPLVRATLDN